MFQKTRKQETFKTHWPLWQYYSHIYLKVLYSTSHIHSFPHTHTHTYTQAFDRDTAFALSHIHSSRERSCFNEGKHPVNSRAEISSLPSGYLLSDLKWEGQICLGHINKNAAKCCMEFIPVFLLSLTNMFSLLPHFPQA